MTTFEDIWEGAADRPPEDVRALFHRLWSKAVGTPDYDRDEWEVMQAALWNLAGWTQPGEAVEPEPWNGNGLH